LVIRNFQKDSFFVNLKNKIKYQLPKIEQQNKHWLKEEVHK
jgi:hypothetical protein